MSDIHLRLQELAARCQAILDAMRSPDAAVVDASAKLRLTTPSKANNSLSTPSASKEACTLQSSPHPASPRFASV